MAADKEVKTKVILDGSFDGLVAAMQKSQKAVETGVGHISGSFGQIGHSIEGVIDIVGKLTTVIAGGAAFKRMISEAGNWIGDLAKLSRTLGITVEQASITKVAMHGLGIETDTVTNAVLRIAKAMNADAGASIKSLGVNVVDVNGKLRNNFDVMLDVNQALSKLEAGSQRNSAGLAVYKKSWGEMQTTLRLTRQEMDEAAHTAEKLHLVFSSQNVAEVREYKKQLNELKLVGESLAINVGTVLIKELKNLALVLNHDLPPAMGKFIGFIHECNAEIYRLGMHTDRVGGTLTTVGYVAAKAAKIAVDATPAGPLIGKKITSISEWMDDQNKNYEKRYNEKDKYLQKLANLEVGLDEDGKPIKIKEPPNGEYDPSKGEEEEKGKLKTETLLTQWQAEKKNLEAAALIAETGYDEYTKKIIEINKKAEAAQSKFKTIKGASTVIETTRLTQINRVDDDILEQSDKAKISRAFDKASMLAKWDSTSKESLTKEQEFNAARAMIGKDASLQEELRIKQEEDEWVQSWAMQTSSFEEYERRKTLIAQMSEEKRVKYKQENPMSNAQQQAFDKKASLARWDTLSEESLTKQMQNEEKLAADRAAIGGDTTLQEEMRIKQEEDAWIQSWAMQTSSFEEYERRKTLIAQMSDEKRKKNRITVEGKTNQELSSMQLSALNNGVGLLNVFAGKSKAAAKATLVIQKGLAMGQIWMATLAAEMRTIAELGYILGVPAAAQIRTWGMINMGLVAATGIAEVAMSGGGGGNTDGGTPSSPIVTQPVNSTGGNPSTITINMNGIMIGEERWAEERLAPIIKDLSRNRNVNFGFNPTSR